MTQSPALICKLLASSVSIAHKAGSIIRDIAESGRLNPVAKGLNDFRTDADVSSQRSIVASFKNLYPKVNIVAEENDNESKDLEVPEEWLTKDLDPDVLQLKCPEELKYIKENEVTIWVDPLDGTSEFSSGCTDHVTILIGISVNNVPVAGVIYQPFWKNEGRAVWGLVGFGIRGLKFDKLPVVRTYVTTRSHSNKVLESFIEKLEPCKVIKVGGAGNKVLYLLEGKAHAYVFPISGCRRWDTAAPEAVLRAAGGELTDIFGKKYSYTQSDDFLNKTGVIATAPGFDHATFMKLIEQIRSSLQIDVDHKTNKLSVVNHS